MGGTRPAGRAGPDARCCLGPSPPRCGEPAPDRIFAVTVPDAATLDVPADAAAAVVAAAEQVLAGEWTALGVRRTDSADPDWFYDPLTGRQAPSRRLAFRIHHRDETETGNIKQVWEIRGTTTSPCWRPPGG